MRQEQLTHGICQQLEKLPEAELEEMALTEEEQQRAIEELEAKHRNGNQQSASEDSITPLVSVLDDLDENTPPGKLESTLRALAAKVKDVDPLRLATVRETSIKKLEKIGIGSPARLIDSAFQIEKDGNLDQLQGKPITFDDPEPWPQVVNGPALLDEIVSVVKKYVVVPSKAEEAIALWIIHAHAFEIFTISPILAITSVVKQSGKTLLLEIISFIIVRTMFASNISPASLFRTVEKFKPCFLIDEADTFLKDNDELRGIINASHRKISAKVVRTVGDNHEPVEFNTYCPKAIALIGKLPETLEDRAILIKMKRKGPQKSVDKFQFDKVSSDLITLKRKIIRWVADNRDALRKAEPASPDGLSDRAADNWRPLLAVADIAGGENWPKDAREVAKVLNGAVSEADNSAAIQILGDLKKLFEECNSDRLSSEKICEALGKMEDRPWPEWKKGKPITQRQLAKLLSGFEVSPKTIRISEDETPKGYLKNDLIESFTCYLPPQSATPPQATPSAALRDITDPQQEKNVADKKGAKYAETQGCGGVADQNPLFPEGKGYREAL